MNAALSLSSGRSTSERSLAALAFTALVHALLLLGWQMTRRLPAPVMADPPGIQWIDLRPRAPAWPRPVPEHTHQRTPERTPTQPHARADARAPAREAAVPQAIPQAIPRSIGVLPAPGLPASPAGEPAPLPASSAPLADSSGAAAVAAATVPGAASTAAPGGPLLQGALRAAGAVDKALRKENRAYIIAPPDSAQMRMRRGMQAAHDMAAPRLWEAPKIEELVNNTGDGTHHTRIISGGGTYCINERSTHVSIDTIETLGKVTPHLSCPEHETPAGSQEWKTARD